MFSFFSGRKKQLEAEQIALFQRMMADSLSPLKECVDALQRVTRRNQAALESILMQQEESLSLLRQKMDEEPQMQALSAFAESFALAQLNTPQTTESRILSKKLNDLLASFGIALIADTGVPFDPARHEASVVRSEHGVDDGIVLDIVRPGFLLRNHVLRAASVIINRIAEESGDGA